MTAHYGKPITPLWRMMTNERGVDARKMVRVKGAIGCVVEELSIILFIFIVLPHVLSSPSCLSLSSPLSIPSPLQDLPAVPTSASPFHLSPPSLQLPQYPGLFQPRNRLNCTRRPLILRPPCPCTLPRSRLRNLLPHYQPGGLSHRPRQPFCPFPPLHVPLFVVALIQGLLPPSLQGLVPRQRRGACLCLHAICTLLTPPAHHLHFESIGVVHPWMVQCEGSFTLKAMMPPLMMAMTPTIKASRPRSSSYQSGVY